MLRRYAMMCSFLLLMLCHCASSTAPTMDQCDGNEPCPNASTSSTSAAFDVDSAIPPAAATGLADRLRPIEPNLADPSTEPGDAPSNGPTMQNPSDESLLNFILGDTAPLVGNSIDPFTSQLLDAALLPDMFTSLTDSLIGNTIDPSGPPLDRTFLEQSCRNRGIEDFICRQRYGH